MKLYSLYFGRSKKRINQLLMTDSFEKCKNYKEKREKTIGAKCALGFHEIREATNEEIEKGTYKKKGANRETGYITKNGWNPHT